VYFLHTVVSIYRRPAEDVLYPPAHHIPRYVVAALFVSMLMTVYLGIGSGPIMRVIESGLKMFA